MTKETGKKYLDSIFCCMSSMNQAIKYKNKLNKDNYRILRYEDLVGNKEICIREICEFLNIEFDSGMLDISKSIDIVHGKLDKNSHTSFPESKKLHGNWVHKLDQDEISIINTLLGDQMKFFSYQPTNKISSIDLESLANKLFSNENLLLQRWANFKLTNDGVEAYPSDPTKQKNWVKRSGISGEGASKEYIKFNS